jgi:hypothetical protein
MTSLPHPTPDSQEIDSILANLTRYLVPAGWGEQNVNLKRREIKKAKQALQAYCDRKCREGRTDEIKAALYFKGKNLVDGVVIDTANFEGGNPNSIDARILEERLAALQEEEK